MVVMPRHCRRFVADNGLDDVQRNASIGRKRDEGVPQGVLFRRPSNLTEVTIFAALKIRAISWLTCQRARLYISQIVGKTGPERDWGLGFGDWASRSAAPSV